MDIVGQWTEYFEDLLKPTDAPSVEEGESGDEGDESPITEFLKALHVVGLTWLTCLCNVTWSAEVLPLDWQTGVVFPILEKGDRMVCSNFQRITFLSLPVKIQFYLQGAGKRLSIIQAFDLRGTM